MSEASFPRPAGKSPAPPASGAIAFQCPNGHRISVPAKLAGKRGACSKCGTAVVIPAATLPAVPAAVTNSLRGAAPLVERGSAPPEPGLFAAGDEPVPGDEGTITIQSVPPWMPPSPSPSSAPRPAVPHAAPQFPADTSLPQSADQFSDQAARPITENPTALLVARLWAERDHGGVVELHLVGGSVILPEWYEPRWSLGSHGLFASQAADGSVTLTAVAWDSIQKVVVRQVEGLPDGMFE